VAALAANPSLWSLVLQAKPGFSTELKNEQHDKKVSNM
jgi:hypothetical protein